ncbi:DedD protein [Sulfuritortus calidifontis]|uniref:DedD protein n=1 Tax=Sulfuritortus calidifontis TaxID=1914471 RepID=A0A4R3JUJ3_9PROT|nr:SPOR domain-containing protein [Sulfuritortus calidifontis]TCS70102.1 DedD protein [Sulfuritortus calidifontis]
MAEETIQEEGGDIRRRALFRLAVAAAVTSAALAGLWWLDHSGKQEKAKPTPPPKPIVSAPPPAPALAPEQAAGTEATPAPAEPPPPPVIGKLPEPAPAAPSVAKPAQPPSPAPSKPLPSTAVASAIVPAAKGGFVVQLGVFSNPDNARELVEKLRQQGIRAEMETRVHVGPFLNRAEAEKAQAELRKLGLTPVVTTVNGARK